jgi:hypothetical protein
MKTVAAQRVVPLRPSKSGRNKKNLRPIDIRRHTALKRYWDLAKGLGADLNLTRIGKRKGLRGGAMASHCLLGRERLNVEWMLLFAQELGVPPQMIWADDWPFSDFTAAYTNSAFVRLLRRWTQLSATAHTQIMTIIEAEQRRLKDED